MSQLFDEILDYIFSSSATLTLRGQSITVLSTPANSPETPTSFGFISPYPSFLYVSSSGMPGPTHSTSSLRYSNLLAKNRSRISSKGGQAKLPIPRSKKMKASKEVLKIEHFQLSKNEFEIMDLLRQSISKHSLILEKLQLNQLREFISQ